MEKSERILGMLSLSRKAGKLICGFDTVKEQLAKNADVSVYIASDVSEKTAKEMRFLTEKYGAALYGLPMTMLQIGGITGRLNGVLCVTEKNLAKKINGIIVEQTL